MARFKNCVAVPHKRELNTGLSTVLLLLKSRKFLLVFIFHFFFLTVQDGDNSRFPVVENWVLATELVFCKGKHIKYFPIKQLPILF